MACYLSAGRILVYSLPSLRELFNTTLDSAIDSYRTMIGLSFTFTDRGHALYMCSPTEIQKMTISSDVKYVRPRILGCFYCQLFSYFSFQENKLAKCYANYIVHRYQCLKHQNRISLRNYLPQIQWSIPINYVNFFSFSEFYCFFLLLVGEAAGKAPAGVIKREDANVNMDQLRGKANSATSAIHDTRMVR